MILDGTILNADINASAAIDGTKVSPNFGSQDVVTTGNVTVNGQGDVRFGDSNSSNYVGFQAPAVVAANLTWTLPAADGTNGQVLKHRWFWYAWLGLRLQVVQLSSQKPSSSLIRTTACR
jgi:hypothetical protein